MLVTPAQCAGKYIAYTHGLAVYSVKWETFMSRDGKFYEENMCRTLSKSDPFCERYEKNIWMFFCRFTVSTAVHLQNAKLSFTR